MVRLSEKNLQIKKRHHYVWANYLSRWSDDKKNVFYSTKTKRIARDSIRGIAVDDYFYKTSYLSECDIEVIKWFSKQSPEYLQRIHMAHLKDYLAIQKLESLYRSADVNNIEAQVIIESMKCNFIENYHAAHESAALPILERIANEDVEVLNDNERQIEFLTFFGQQITRTKTIKEKIAKALDRRTKVDTTHANSIASVWWFLSYMYGINIGGSLYNERDNSVQTILVNDSKVPFITSDQPIVNVHESVSENEFKEPEKADFYYPISPRIAYVICDSTRFPKGKFNINEDIAIEMNTKIAGQALTYLVGDSKEAIEPFIKFIGSRYKNI